MAWIKRHLPAVFGLLVLLHEGGKGLMRVLGWAGSIDFALTKLPGWVGAMITTIGEITGPLLTPLSIAAGVGLIAWDWWRHRQRAHVRGAEPMHRQADRLDPRPPLILPEPTAPAVHLSNEATELLSHIARLSNQLRHTFPESSNPFRESGAKLAAGLMLIEIEGMADIAYYNKDAYVIYTEIVELMKEAIHKNVNENNRAHVDALNAKIQDLSIKLATTLGKPTPYRRS